MQILSAGTYAPTAMNRQSPIILAVTDPAVREELSRLNAAVMGSSGDPFYGAPVVLAVLAGSLAAIFVLLFIKRRKKKTNDAKD